MRKVIILLFCVFSSYAFSSSYEHMNCAIESELPIDKNTEIKANLRQAKYMIEHGNYEGAKKKLERVLYLDPDNPEAKELLSECQAKIEEKVKAEHNAYFTASKAATPEALKEFIASYPNSQYKNEAEKRIKDYELWTATKKENTRLAYYRYLQQSSFLFFEKEAKEAIALFDANDEWERCKNSESISELENFLRKYDNTPFSKEAKYRLNILNGENNYKLGKHLTAYSYLSEANSYSELSGIPAQHFKELKEEKNFSDIKSSSDINKIKSYLRELSTDNKFYIPTSNHLALLLAKNLTMYSADYSMNEALIYAKDEATIKTVKGYIQRAKDAYSYNQRQQRRQAHKRWWKENFKIGINGDVETNLDSNSGLDLFYSAGLSIRFGSYKHLFNMDFGVKYRWFRVKQDHYDNVFKHFGGAISIPLNIRFNIARISTRSRLFIGAGGEYGVSMFEDKSMKGCFEKNFISVYPKIGITSPNFDISIHWKSYLKGPFINEAGNYSTEYKCNSMIGTQIAFYF